MIEQICLSYPIESKAEFKMPIVWNSRIAPEMFISHATASLWTIKEPSKSHKFSISSVLQRTEGQPVFYMELLPGDGQLFKAKVSSFDYLFKFLQIANEQKLTELKSMLQNSRDPISHIFGIPGDSGKVIVDAFDTFNNETDPKKKEQYQKLYKLLLVINSFDLQVLSKIVKNIEKSNGLDIHKVQDEMDMLASFCGREDQNALVKIDWELDFTFSDGFKAPPWRQVFGEISYIRVQCQDKDELIVTASKKGYFINKGYTTDGSGNQHLNYEKVGEVYGSLVDILKVASPHFAQHIDQQGFIYHRDAGREVGFTAVAAETNDQIDGVYVFN
jgi:hypothetical protein